MRTFANRGLQEQKALPISLLPQFDPFELSIGNLFDLLKDRCDAGYALSKLDTDKAILLDQDGDLETVVFQQRPGSLLTVTFSERNGGMPIRTRITASMDRNTLTLQPKGEINYLTYETVCVWKQSNGTWYPVESQVSHIGRFLKPRPTEKSRWDFEFRWYDGKEISYETIDRMDPETLWQLVDEKANVKREKRQ